MFRLDTHLPSLPSAIASRWCGLLLLAATWLGAVDARAADVGVLLVGDNPRYVSAAKAAARGLGVEVTGLPETTSLPPPSWGRGAPRVIVAIGSRAVRTALLVPDAVVVAAMVLQEGEELKDPRVVAVPFVVPLERQLQLLQRIAPRAKRVGIVVDPRASGAALAEARAAAGLTAHVLVVKEVSDPDAAQKALEALPDACDAILVLPDATVVKRAFLDRAAALETERHIPVLGFSASLVQYGYLAAVAPEPDENAAAATSIAKKLLAGAAPDSVRSDGRLAGHVYIHKGKARELGLTIPSDLAPPVATVFDR